MVDYSPPEQVYLDREGLAKRFYSSTRSIDEWRKDPVDPLPFRKIGSKVLFYWPEAVSWMDRRRVSRPSDPGAEDMADKMLSGL
jgi:hypothetical protein